MKAKKIIKRVAIYFVFVMLAFLLQTCLFPMVPFLYAVPNFLLIITFSYGFIYGGTTGIVCGSFAGLLMDLFYPSPFGLFVLLFTYLGFFSGFFCAGYRNDSMLLPMLLCLVCDGAYNAAMILYRIVATGKAELVYILKNIVLPEMFFTLIVTAVVYHLLLKANRRLDAIDDFRGQNAA